MGRRVYEKSTGEFVWKYTFAEQTSEQYRIADEIDVGHVMQIDYGDILMVENTEANKEDLYKYLTEKRAYQLIDEFELFLEDNVYTYEYDDEGNIKYVGIPVGKSDLIEEWKRKNCPDIRFYQMVATYLEFMESHPKIETFYFEGEY